MAKLTIKQKKFADYYIETGNATQSAIRAGYSKKTANRIATENLSKLVISEYIQKRLKELEKSRLMTVEEALL
ncbi:terminase small subunit, partial [Lactococcus petauri]